jgi:hypothetical protein
LNRRTIYRYKFAVEANARARMVFNLIAGGFLSASSVGLYTNKVVSGRSDEEEIEALPDFARAALVKGQARYIITKSTLVEVSSVFVGANKDALAVTRNASPDPFAVLFNRAERAVQRLEQAADLAELGPDFARFVRTIQGKPDLMKVLKTETPLGGE